MKYLKGITVFTVLLIIPCLLFSQGIVIDHTCTDITKIPDSWISKVKSMLKIHYAHTSHGEQVTVGLERLDNANSKYAYYPDNCTIPDTTQYLSLMDGQYIYDYCETYITPDLYWEGSDAMDITRFVLNTFDANVSLWAWCTQLDYYSQAEVAVYLAAISKLEKEYPGVTFVYFTGNAQSFEQNRVDRNDQIRQYCRDHNKILFDFADLDCWYNGEQYTDHGIPMEHPHYNGDEAGHTTYESCENKARAFWWLLARIAGWDGSSGETTQPAININKSQLNFYGTVGGSNPAVQTFTVSNTGEGTLNWTVTDNASWLSCSPTSGQNTGTVTVTVDISGLAAGTYNKTITVSDPNASNTPQTLPVTLTVNAGGGGTPVIELSRETMYFGAANGTTTSPQTFLITNSGTGTLNWNAGTDAGWLSCSPASGSGTGTVTVTVDDSGLSAGTYVGTVTVTDSNASNSPQTVDVTLTVFSAGQDSPPFGSFETPLNGSTVQSSVPVTGWVIDDIEVQSVKIYNGGSFIGDAVLVEGARPDVEQLYYDYPNSYKAGWGYMLLTNFLPDGGNGTFTLYAKAADSSGNEVTLGSKTIICDNANAVKPFGAIDTPLQGGSASGANFINWGWVLTPQPNAVPTDGSTIDVYVDGYKLGHPTYNIYRNDIATLFPGYANSNGAVGYFSLDTTTYENGVHTIQWVAADDAGNADGIGSRYFSIQNSGAERAQRASQGIPAGNRFLKGIHSPETSVDCSTPVEVIKGFASGIEPLKQYPDTKGTITVDIRELERLEIRFISASSHGWEGFLRVGDLFRSLPVGSTLDRKKGIFYWMPGIGFSGNYELVFADTGTGLLRKINITVSARYR